MHIDTCNPILSRAGRVATPGGRDDCNLWSGGSGGLGTPGRWDDPRGGSFAPIWASAWARMRVVNTKTQRSYSHCIHPCNICIDMCSASVDVLRMEASMVNNEQVINMLSVLGKVDLSATNCMALFVLVEQGGMTRAELSRGLGLSSAAMTGLVDRMMGRGLFEESVDLTDRRKRILHATAAGHSMAERVREGSSFMVGAGEKDVDVVEKGDDKH